MSLIFAMTPSEALDQTIKLFGIKAKDISAATGIGENRISRYRNGRGMSADTLQAILKALPAAAQFHYLILITSCRPTETSVLNDQPGIYKFS